MQIHDKQFPPLNPLTKPININMTLDVVVFGVKEDKAFNFSVSMIEFDRAISINTSKLKAKTK